MDKQKEKQKSIAFLIIGLGLILSSSIILIFDNENIILYENLDSSNREWGYRIGSKNGFIIDFNIKIDPSSSIIAIIAPFDSKSEAINGIDWSFYTSSLYNDYYTKVDQTWNNVNFNFNEVFANLQNPGLGQDIVLVIQNQVASDNSIVIEISSKILYYIYILEIFLGLGCISLTAGINKSRNLHKYDQIIAKEIFAYNWNSIHPDIREDSEIKFQLKNPEGEQDPDSFSSAVKSSFEKIYNFFLQEKQQNQDINDITLPGIFSGENFTSKFQENERNFYKSVISGIINSFKDSKGRFLNITKDEDAFPLISIASQILKKLSPSKREGSQPETELELNNKEQLTIKLQRFEATLRGFISKIILERFGKNWWKIEEAGQDPLLELKKKAKTRLREDNAQKKKLGEQLNDNLFDFLEFLDYKDIIITHWELKGGKPLFAQYFPKKETIIEYLEYLNLHRKDILGHDRAILSNEDIEKVEFYMKEFSRMFSKTIRI